MGLPPVHASSSGLSEVINLVSWQLLIILDSPLSGECDFRGEKSGVQVRGGWCMKEGDIIGAGQNPSGAG
jgi:hypothetical protein